MKINFSILDEPLKVEDLTVISIEDVKLFSSVVEWLYNYSEESDFKIYDSEFNSLSPQELLLITDVLNYSPNTSTILKKIYSDLEVQINLDPEVKSELEKYLIKIEELIGHQLIDHSLDLVSEDLSISKLMKALSIKVKMENRSIFNKILDIVEVYKYLAGKKLLIFVNTCSYMTVEELAEFRSYIILNNTRVLMIEPREIPDYTNYFLDKDYFLFKRMI